MARSDTEIQRSFTGGEQSESLGARADLARWRTAAAVIENFVCVMTGGATRRPGWRDCGAAMSQTANASVLLPFAFSATDGYAIEAGIKDDASPAFRFWRDFGVLLDGGDPYEIASPFGLDELALLRTAQSADKLFIASGARQHQQLARLGNTDWTIGAVEYENGPFREPNAVKTWKLWTDYAGGEIDEGTNINHISNPDTFTAGMVGALFLIRAPDFSKYGKWSADDTQFTVGNFAVWDGNVYKCTAINGSKTGVNPPVHLLGEEWDGNSLSSDNGRKWLYLHSGWGVVEITGYVDAQNATAISKTYVPSDLKGSIGAGGTWRWAEGAWSDYRGFARLIALSKKRLYAFSNTADPTGAWASVIDDYPNHNAQHPDEATAAFSVRLEADTGKVNIPQWVAAGQRLAVGTSGDEHVVVSADGNVIAGDSVDIVPATTEGSLFAPAVLVDGPLFISKNAKRIHELTYDPQAVTQNTYIAPDLTIMADHIAGPGFKKIVWQREPHRLLWALRTDGTLACCTYRKDQEVTAWHRHPVAGAFFEDIAAVSAPDGTRQDVFAIVRLTLASGTVRRIWALTPFFPLHGDVRDGVFLDGAFVYDGAPAASIGGLELYEGETLAILADGKVHPPRAVSGGAVALDYPAAKAAVGRGFASVITTLRADKDNLGGALAGRAMQAGHATLDLLDAAAVEVRAGQNDWELATPSAGGTMGAAAVLHSGAVEKIKLAADWSDSDVSVRCASPLPATIRAIGVHFRGAS